MDFAQVLAGSAGAGHFQRPADRGRVPHREGLAVRCRGPASHGAGHKLCARRVLRGPLSLHRGRSERAAFLPGEGAPMRLAEDGDEVLEQCFWEALRLVRQRLEGRRGLTTGWRAGSSWRASAWTSAAAERASTRPASRWSTTSPANPGDAARAGCWPPAPRPRCAASWAARSCTSTRPRRRPVHRGRRPSVVPPASPPAGPGSRAASGTPPPTRQPPALDRGHLRGRPSPACCRACRPSAPTSGRLLVWGVHRAAGSRGRRLHGIGQQRARGHGRAVPHDGARLRHTPG